MAKEEEAMKTIYARFRVSGGNDQGAMEWLRNTLLGINTRTVVFDGLVEPEEAAKYMAPEKQSVRDAREAVRENRLREDMLLEANPQRKR
jgi:hypothetical protein